MSGKSELGGWEESTEDGELLLARLLPSALALVPEIEISSLGGLGPLASIITQANLASVEIEPLHGDLTPVLILKDVPPSFPTRLEASLGYDSPHEAEEAAIGLIAAVIKASSSPFFILDEHRLPLSREILDVLKSKQIELIVHYPDLETLEERIRTIVSDALPDGFDLEPFQALALEIRSPMMMLIHIGAFMGIASIDTEQT